MRNKGFTLIELLAVILILAIIALIAVPTIGNIIDQSKEGSFKSSVQNIVKAIEDDCVIRKIKGFELKKDYVISEKKIIPTVEINNISYIEGQVLVDDSCNTKVYLSNDKFVGKKNYSDIDVTITKGFSAYDDGSIIYFNPNDGISCSEIDYNNNSNKIGNSGCLKWYAFLDNANKNMVDLILDHNIGKTSIYNSQGNINYGGPNGLLISLNRITSEWNKYLNIRVITAYEIADIVGYNSWNNDLFKFSDYCSSKDCSWLYTNLSYSEDYSTTQLHRGYWTGTGNTSYVANAFFIYYSGSLTQINSNNGSYVGVRPVITINKGKLE